MRRFHSPAPGWLVEVEKRLEGCLLPAFATPNTQPSLDPSSPGAVRRQEGQGHPHSWQRGAAGVRWGKGGASGR